MRRNDRHIATLCSLHDSRPQHRLVGSACHASHELCRTRTALAVPETDDREHLGPEHPIDFRHVDHQPSHIDANCLP